MTRAALLGGVAATLAVLCACEDNEHPFGDNWYVACEGAPAMNAVFTEPTQLDDAGSKREYLGYVEVFGPDFADVWVWQVAVDTNENSATTVALDHVPVPDDYVTGDPMFRDLDLDVATYDETADTTAARMTGECTYGDVTGALTMDQSDDCDLCFDCDTGGAPAGLGVVAPLLALLVRRRRDQSAQSPWNATHSSISSGV